MKLSKKTLDVLKTFANINSNLLLVPGKKIETMSVAKNIFGDATIDEEIPQEFGIYNTQEFLGALSLFKDPELVFEEKHVRIKEATGGGMSLKYMAASKDILVYPTKKVQEPKWDVEFDLSGEDFNQVIKGAAVISAPDLQIVGTDQGLFVRVCDRKNSSSNDFVVQVNDQPQVEDFTFNLKVDNLKLFPGSYKVAVNGKGLAKFQETNSKVITFIALEAA